MDTRIASENATKQILARPLITRIVSPRGPPSPGKGKPALIGHARASNKPGIRGFDRRPAEAASSGRLYGLSLKAAQIRD
jgi:hypothetical protein